MFTRWLLLALVLTIGQVQAKEHQPASSPQMAASATAVAVESKHDKPNYEMFVAWGTIALAFVTGGLWFATYQLGKQAKESGERQDEALRAIERSYLFVEVLLTGQPITGSPSPRRNDFRVKIWNHGKTPAEIIQISVRAQILADDPTKLDEPPHPERTVPPGLAIAQNESFELIVQTGITNEDMHDIENLKRRLFIVGQVEYRDIFGTERETDFCWGYVHNLAEPRFVIAPISDLNRRT